MIVTFIAIDKIVKTAAKILSFVSIKIYFNNFSPVNT